MTKLKLFFLRHGQTQFNVYRRLQGWSNSQLTEKGITVAQEAGRAFSDISFEAVYSSDLTRAIETGRIFLAQRDQQQPPIQEVKKLREVGFGYYEGLYGPEVWKIAEDRARDVYDLEEDAVITEGMKLNMLKELDPAQLAENYDDFSSRLLDAMADIVGHHSHGNLLLVSHSSAIKALFNLLDPDYKTDVDPENGSVSVMTYENGRYRVVAYNIFNREELDL
ncbi:putative phosphoglycerate mutase [Streptococcus rupicaprae]|uniref:Phosphoglycerate mutase n=1 Tax=Streptococcus rupicaprae TaxID=759619 RepID=A0ABV2FGH0_9STRE